MLPYERRAHGYEVQALHRRVRGLSDEAFRGGGSASPEEQCAHAEAGAGYGFRKREIVCRQALAAIGSSGC